MKRIEIVRVERHEACVPVEELVHAYRDVPFYEALCRQCPGYGLRWGCPPFHDDPQPAFEAFESMKLVMLKVFLADVEFDSHDEANEALSDVVRRVRFDYEVSLLAGETASHGRAALFTGMCPYCGDSPCARAHGDPCRHPDKIRPSLEALGFDVVGIARDVFSTELLWAANKKTPSYLCLIGGIALNRSSDL